VIGEGRWVMVDGLWDDSLSSTESLFIIDSGDQVYFLKMQSQGFDLMNPK